MDTDNSVMMARKEEEAEGHGWRWEKGGGVSGDICNSVNSKNKLKKGNKSVISSSPSKMLNKLLSVICLNSS